MSLGIWSPEIETVYGVTQAEYQNYLRSQMQPQAYSSYSSGGSSRSRSSSGGGSGGYGEGYIDDSVVYQQPVQPAAKAATVQNSQTAQRTSNARNSYANEIKSIQKNYNLSASEATKVRDMAKASGISVAEAYALYAELK